MADTILLVGGDRLAEGTARAVLERSSAEVVMADTATALTLYDKLRPDVVTFAVPADGGGALELLGALVSRGAAVVALAAPESAIAGRALATGAEQLLVTPIEQAQFAAALDRVRDRVALRREHRWLQARRMARGGLETLGTSPGMRALIRRIEQVARDGSAPVLLAGEIGTEKGWIARMIHELGATRPGPFIEAGPATSEAALFGQEADRPGAVPRRRGLLEIAERGSLYIVEIADLAPAAQRALATVLSSGTLRRVGGASQVPVSVRILAATSRDLPAAVRDGTFLADLHDRSGMHVLRLPAVRERTREDRVALVHSLVAELGRRVADLPYECGVEALDRLVAAPWPGNVRELRAVLERALLLARGARTLEVQHLPADFQDGRALGGDAAAEGARPAALADVEREYIERALRYHRGNRTRAAHDLGISRATLINKIKVYALDL